MPRLYARTQGDWIPVLPPVRTPWYGLVFNPRGNFQLVHQSLLERFVAEAGESKNPRELVSYQILSNACAAELRARALLPAGGEFQFRITVNDEDVILSSAIGVER